MNPDQNMDHIPEGDRAAFLTLYRTYYHVLFAAGRYITTNKELIRDCIHQLFLHCWVQRAELQRIQNLKNYLTVSLRNRLLTALKQQNRLTTYDTDQVDENELIEISYEEILIQNITEQAMQDKLQQALASLSPRYRKVIEMRFFQERTYEEISELTGQPVKTTYNYVHEALTMLRKAMKSALSLLF